MTPWDTQTPDDPNNPPNPNLENGWNFNAAKNVDDAKRAVASGDQRAIYLAAKGLVGTGYTIDPKTGQVREKTWWEEHGDTTMFLATAAASLFGGYYLATMSPGVGAGAGAASGGGSGAAAGGGVGVGETGAVTGLAGSGFGTGGGLGYAAVGAPAAGGALPATTLAPTSGTMPAASAVASAAGAGTRAAGKVPWNWIIGGAAEGLNTLSNRDQAEQDRALQEKKLALDASTQDPYRGQMMQTRDLARLDMMANLDTHRPSVTAPAGRYADAMPTLDRGGWWEPSQGLRDSATAAQRSVASGEGAFKPGDAAIALRLASLYGPDPNADPTDPNTAVRRRIGTMPVARRA